MLQIQEVSYGFADRTVLDSVNFKADAGEFIALMGANGAGKSTLLDLIAGLRNPAHGNIFLDGKTLADWPLRERSCRISHLPQLTGADLPFRTEELVLMGRYPHTDQWHESPADHAAVELAMRQTSCLQFRGRRFSTLSGGERQRVLLAACLAQQAAVLLLDEPSTFLDVEQQLECFSLLQRETERGVACIAVTHDLNLALAHCTRIVVLADNRVAADIPVNKAHQTDEWLALFSKRLRMGQTPEGRPWVWFQ